MIEKRPYDKDKLLDLPRYNEGKGRDILKAGFQR